MHGDEHFMVTVSLQAWAYAVHACAMYACSHLMQGLQRASHAYLFLQLYVIAQIDFQ